MTKQLEKPKQRSPGTDVDIARLTRSYILEDEWSDQKHAQASELTKQANDHYEKARELKRELEGLIDNGETIIVKTDWSEDTFKGTDYVVLYKRQDGHLHVQANPDTIVDPAPDQKGDIRRIENRHLKGRKGSDPTDALEDFEEGLASDDEPF